MKKGLYYLAIPYHGTEEQKAYRTGISLKTTSEFLHQGIHVFSPVIYVNQIVEKMNLTSIDERRQVVMPYLLSFLKISKGMVIIEVDGWQSSWGVKQELKFCQTNNIPVYMMSLHQVRGNLIEIFESPLSPEQMDKHLKVA